MENCWKSSLIILAIGFFAAVVGCTPEPDVEFVQIVRGDHLQDRALTEQMFASMNEGGVSPNQPLLWGYFFYGDKRPLAQAWEQLRANGYRLVRLELIDPEPGEEPLPILHVEKVEQHTVDSLLQRNKELTAIASPLGVVYDGMDVGPPGE